MMMVDDGRAPSLTPGQAIERLERHTGTLAAGGLVLFVALRLLAVARFNLITAAALLDAEGTASVTTGVLLQLVPMVMLAVGFIAAAVVFASPGQRELVVVLIVVAGVIVMSAPWPFTLGVPFGAVTGVCVDKLRTVPGGLQRLRDWSVPHVVMVLAVSVGMSVVHEDSPWLPAERLVIAGQPDVTGYVLANANGQIVVLTGETREVRRYAATDVVRRSVCDNRPDNMSTWMERQPRLFAADSADYPDCPS